MHSERLQLCHPGYSVGRGTRSSSSWIEAIILIEQFSNTGRQDVAIIIIFRLRGLKEVAKQVTDDSTLSVLLG